jgi:hypothetical protein
MANVTLPKGVAHVSYRGGGCFLPVRTAYGRELLVEYVVDLVRTKGLVQVLIDEGRWLAEAAMGRPAVDCVSCERPTQTRCDHDGAGPYCVPCAFRDEEKREFVGAERRRAS